MVTDILGVFFLHTVFECGSTIVLAPQKSAMQAIPSYQHEYPMKAFYCLKKIRWLSQKIHSKQNLFKQWTTDIRNLHQLEMLKCIQNL